MSAFGQSALSSISWALLGWWGEMMMPFISLAERRAWKPDKLSPPKPFFSPVFYDRKDFLGLVGLFFSIVKSFFHCPAEGTPCSQPYNPCMSTGDLISGYTKTKLKDVFPTTGT